MCKCVCLPTLIYINALHPCADEKTESENYRYHHCDEEEEAAEGNEKCPHFLMCLINIRK